MTQNDLKPLNWDPDPEIGYSVERRPDGGMNVTFTDLNPATLLHWREFALEHLIDSDRQTRNLYDLRRVETIPTEAVSLAIEANSDPASRNIRLAVVVANESVRRAVFEIAALSTAPGGGSSLQLFTSMDAAEDWLSQPLDTLL
ncbi:MAG TPA: hypothetical protein VMN57_17320 [Anaerolineales bacterium]|nr:hypothetical protein [Anaerolineales bacterium]